MNREIKFRTWDTENKEFSEWTNRDPFFSTSEGLIFFWERTQKDDGSYGGDIILRDNRERFVLQQFTGLKDKNDKEIYEGDVVKIRRYDDWDDTVGFDVIYQVKWCDKHAGWRGFTIGMIEKNYAGSGLPEPIEIIGNIFENPELLK